MNKFDPYVWTRDKLEEFRQKTTKIKHDGLIPSTGDIWSIKKCLVLDYCIDGFARIFQKFPKRYYVDTHCGAGLIDFRKKELHKEKFPGTPLIAAFRSQKYAFSKYFFSDNDDNATDALGKMLDLLKSDIPNCSHEVETRDFAETVRFLKQFRGWNGFLIVIDPKGFKEIKWSHMKSLLEIETADIFFNFMTSGIARNRGKVKDDDDDETFNQFYDSDEWKSCTNGNELKELYKQKIRKERTYVFDIPVGRSEEDVMYNIIIATNSKGASNVVESAMKIAEVETDMINAALQVAAGLANDLTQWIPKKNQSDIRDFF